MKRAVKAAVVLVGLCALACGGVGAAPAPAGGAETTTTKATEAEPSLRYGDVAYKTFEAKRGKYRLVFSTRQTVKKTWSGMSGPAVEGTWASTGQQVEITWDSAATHHGSLSESFEQTGPCSLIRYQRRDRQSGELIEKPMVFEQTQPRCDTVRVMQ